ncbi:MAG: hypothetical protein COY40_05710 [Alphaproteobacteria bacterium CG_4_10_14_0_8_um_filter_53_9]|nr:MAG: hypothetical protein COY40_05710 [Alphaproteobacteria bacterium CG_4_10_14_0_8_um_filter_53_9]
MFVLTGPNPAFRLRLATMDDAENLRLWKNAHKTAFFYQKDITPEQQAGWMSKHLSNKDDFMFMVESHHTDTWLPVGCMGYRLEDGTLDLYNILRGVPEDNATFTMGEAFSLMLAYLGQTYRLPISCVVLRDNPVRGWYEKLGLVSTGEGEKDGIAFVRYALPVPNIPALSVTKAPLA